MGELYTEGLFGSIIQRCQGNDNIYTPENIAEIIVKHFKPKGKILEPCAGTGAFLKYMPNAEWCEIDKGKNFFDYKIKVDWIVTNPPFSKISYFLEHSFKIADNIVFLITVGAAFTVKRVRLMYLYKFLISEILLFKQPQTFPQTGRQLAAIHYKKNYKGSTRIIFDPELISSYSKRGKWPVKIKRHVKR